MQQTLCYVMLSRVAPLLLIAGLTGCHFGSAGGSLQLESREEQRTTLAANFTTAVYSVNELNVASVYLSDAPLEELLSGELGEGQVVHIELLWEPKPGKTPLDESATNVSIRHIVSAGEEVGIYGGAGFGKPTGVGSDRMSLAIPNSTVRLLEHTDGFIDRIGRGMLHGTFTATRDESLVRRLGFAISQIVTNRLGESRYVMLPLPEQDRLFTLRSSH